MFLFVTVVRAELVDAVVHVVGDRIVTRSDVAFEVDFDPHDRSPIPALDAPEYVVSQRLVDFAILRQAAGDIEIYRPRTEDVSARWARFRDAWARPEDYSAFLLRWGMDDRALQGFLYSRLVVERFVARNVLQRSGALLEGLEFDAYEQWIAPIRARADVRTPR